MTNTMAQLKERVANDWRFFRGWIRNPGPIGSVTPTSQVTSRAMAAYIPQDSDLPVLELGPGTGVITRAILERGVAPGKIVSIEHNRDFFEHLVDTFPGVNFFHGDAFAFERVISQTPYRRFSTVIGAVPLLNFPKPKRADLIDRCLDHVVEGGAFVQISYGPKPPTPEWPGHFTVELGEWIVKNVPPARLSVYRRPLA